MGGKKQGLAYYPEKMFTLRSYYKNILPILFTYPKLC